MMDYDPVFRHIKHPAKKQEILDAAEKVRKHWEELALDQGLDPAKNVFLQEGDKEVRVVISEELSTVYREGPGSWR
ncbi:hypothetical protein SAMN05660653_00931 [Desulfonatronum thiosulfatophilum]|uniref:Uncharacterized protein n=1 Tax=Desulfonatronum thiosulfatophilum TaxID=617002 RepID=A0A1G6BDN4_9BACT|nr:hypothetical protein [Desulfonatronum thiosulfatophilum]SDB18735.1 hypothetical protein SAMN05660653_00931 [Desulfonatronum thiosulfatophilum]